MLRCPTCSKRLSRSSSTHGAIYPCRTCGGKAVEVSVLKDTASTDFLRMLRHKWGDRGPQSRRCPLCDEPMVTLDFTGGGHDDHDWHDGGGRQPINIDVCRPCQIVWFDRAEQQKLSPPVEVAQPSHPPGPGDDEPAFALTRADRTWQMVPAVLGLPVEFGPNRLTRKPVLTWALAAAMAAVLIWLLKSGDWTWAALHHAIWQWGFIPNLWDRHNGLTMVTSFFLHAGWWHLIGNAYFLTIFGDNVEDHLGRLRFVLLLAAAHLGGMFLHSAFAAGAGDIPCVGASAGISGVIAYYAIVFPRAKIGIFMWWWTLFRILRMPAMVALLLFVAVQAVGAFLASDELSGVAYFAHIGGLVVGAAAGLLALIFLRDYGPTPT